MPNGFTIENYSSLKKHFMIIVHDIFVCKPGNASKIAKKFKEGMTGNSDLVNIMTDMTGQFNRVIMVTKYDNLTAYEKSWEKYQEKSEEMKKMEQAMAGLPGYVSDWIARDLSGLVNISSSIKKIL